MKKSNLMIINIVAIVILIAPLLYLSLTPLKLKEASLVIRFDDYGIWCDESWEKLESTLLDIHDKYEQSITMAVVPKSIYPVRAHCKTLKIYPHSTSSYSENITPLEFGSFRVERLKKSMELGSAQIALHGYYHPKYYANIKNSDFFNVDYDTQFFKIRRGKVILDSLFNTNVDIFVPPHNNYDNLTLDVLTESGFTILSAKKAKDDAPVDESIPLTYLPYTTESFEYLRSKYIASNGYMQEGSPIDILLLHHTNFTDAQGQIDSVRISQYESFIKLLQNSNVKVLNFKEAYKDSYVNRFNESSHMYLYEKISRLSPVLAANINLLNFPIPIIVFLINLYLFVLVMAIWSFVLLFSINRLRKIKKYIIQINLLTVIVFVVFVLYILKRPFNYGIGLYISSPMWVLISLIAVLSSSIIAIVLYNKVSNISEYSR